MKKLSILLVSIIMLISVAPFASAEQWVPVGMSRDLTYDRGQLGGEGCQVTECVSISKSNPNFLMAGTDVGGIFRSYDHGETWEACNNEFTAKGACEIIIDPMNENHIVLCSIVVATPANGNGLFVSTDGADSWQKTMTFDGTTCQGLNRDSFAFDPTSYDPETGMCMRIYWSAPDVIKALYKSEDGGFTWSPIPNSEQLCDADIEVSDTGEVYIGGQYGFFISSDYGKTFQKVLDDWTLSVDHVSIRPDNVYISTWDKVLISTDKGRSFNIIEGTEVLPIYTGKRQSRYGTYGNFGFRFFNVSPLNPDHMVISCGLASYNWQGWMSQDGGKTWHHGGVEYLNTQIHYSNRCSQSEWSYIDENTVFSVGGDWITKSTNGGLVYRKSCQGMSIFMSYTLSINYHNPDLMLNVGQDYGGFGSYDGGETWTYAVVNPAHRGGSTHNGLIVSEDFAFCVAPKNESNAFDPITRTSERELRIARGYHNLHFEPTGLSTETHMCYQSQNDENILFAGVLRSTDRGETWEKMEGCKGVITHNMDPDGQKELYGMDGTNIVVSYDEGETWTKIASVTYNPDSMAYNWKRGYLFVTAYNRNSLDKIDVRTGDVTTVDSIISSSKRKEVFRVAIDPVTPDLMYIAGPGNFYFNDVSVQRSYDAGETWEVITRHRAKNNVITEGDEGPVEANYVIVHPETRELWVGTACYGTYKLSQTSGDEPKGYYPYEKLFATDRKAEDGVYLRWYGNGKYDLSNVAFESSISDIFLPHNKWYENIYEGFYGKGIPDDNTTKITELEVDTAAWYAFNEWENPIYTYDVMKSTDGKNWTKITTTNAVEFTDTEVESGKTYYYKVVRKLDGKTTVTRTVNVK